MLNLFTFAVVLLPVFSSVTNTFSRMLTPYMKLFVDYGGEAYLPFGTIL